MQHLSIIALVLHAAAPALLMSQQPRPTPDALARATGALVERAFARGITPALGVAVVMDGRTVYTGSFGMADATARVPADDRTLWYVASTSKSFTGFSLALLASRGTLRLDAPIATLLPDARWAEGVDPSRLTLADFLGHRSGLSGAGIVLSTAFTGVIPEPELPRWLILNPPTGSEDLAYSNLGYEVGAMVLNRYDPAGWRAVQARELFEPAGIREIHSRVSGLDPRRLARPADLNEHGAFVTAEFSKTDRTMSAAGGHLGTLHDLARWVIVQCDSGRIDGRQVYPVEAIRIGQTTLAEQTRDRSRRFAMFDRDGWAAGWDIGRYEGERMVSRFGSYASTRSHLSFLPGRRIGVVAMATGGTGSPLTDLIAAYVYDLEAGRADALPRAEQRLEEIASRMEAMRRGVTEERATRLARQRTPLQHPLQAFAGRFTAPGYGTMIWTVRDDRLWFRLGDQTGPAETYDAGRNQVRIEIGGSGTVVTFTFGPEAQASALDMAGITFRREG